MLKSYEAVYHNGHLHWLGIPPPQDIEKRHVMVVVDLEKNAIKPTTDIHQLLTRTRGCLKPLKSVCNIDESITQMRSEWDREWDR
jgi:hypothetical protein